MDRKIFWLRLSYWIGAVTDGLSVIPLLSPRVGNFLFGRDDFVPGPEYRYAMGIAASLMAGWTLLLIWADRKPLARKGILPLTVFPVVLGLFTVQIFGVINGFLAVERVVYLWLHLTAVSALFIFSYVNARDVDDPAEKRAATKNGGSA